MRTIPNIDVNDIIHKAVQVYEVNLDDFHSKCRRRNIVDARRAVYFLLKTHYGISELYQSRLIKGSKHYSTIMYLNETTNDLLDADYDFSFNYKRFFEYVTKVEYLRPIPPQYKKWNKTTIVYDYYTDDMIARSKLKFKDKMKRLSSDYKDKIKNFVSNKPNISAAVREFKVSRRFIEKVLTEKL